MLAGTLTEGVSPYAYLQAQADYERSVAEYRETVLGSFQEVEDSLAALRILAEQAAVQEDAVKAAREVVTITNNQYRAGIANYLAVVIVQAALLSNELTAINLLGRRFTASVNLIKALGGGWHDDALAQASR